MSPPRRRSNRLRGISETPTKPQPHTMHRLSALAEHDESPKSPIPYNLNSIISSPSALRTPATAGRIQPTRDQMHPSIAQQSTAKEPDSGLKLGFTDIPAEPNPTPSKIGPSSPSSFNFRYGKPIPQLGEEAQRMMEGLREEAAKIKAKLSAEREEEKRNGGESTLFSPRKIAQPKPKAGRYSDVHMAEFKKMDSIAGHPSAFRAQHDRPTTASASKRPHAKAGLHESSSDMKAKQTTKSLKRSQSKAELDEPSKGRHTTQNEQEKSSDRLENTAPAKRARQQITDDVSTTRPVSRGGIPVASNQKAKPTFRSRFDAGLKSLTSPTKASAARASGLKQPSTHVPPMSTSASMANMNTTPRGLPKSKTLSSIPRPESSMKAESSVKEPPSISKFDRFKSMLHRNQSPSKAGAPSSIPSLKKSPTKQNLANELPSIPVTPAKDEQAHTAKHVSFTPTTISKQSATLQETPSPKKSGIPRSATMMNIAAVSYPSLSANTTPNASKEISYPNLSTPQPVPDAIKQAATEPRPAQAAPPMFTFRSGQAINFGSSPGQTSIRAVRPSILPSEIPGSYPVSDQENGSGFPTIPHGMSNKKRRRVSSDDEVDEEAVEVDGQSPSKKLKSRAAEGQLLVESLQKKVLPGGMSSPRKSKSMHASPTKNATSSNRKGVLSLSRLNMLARPKSRK